MSKENFNLVDSILEVKASGLDLSVEQDLLIPDSATDKSIAELLNDQEKKDIKKNNIE